MLAFATLQLLSTSILLQLYLLGLTSFLTLMEPHPSDAPSRTSSSDPDSMDTGSTTNIAADNANTVEDITYWTNAYTSDDPDVRSVRDSLLAVIYTFSPFTPFPYHTHRDMYNNIESPIMAASTAAAQAQAEAEVQARIARQQEDKEHLDTISQQITQILKLLDKLEVEGWDGIFLAVCRNVKHTIETGEQLPTTVNVIWLKPSKRPKKLQNLFVSRFLEILYMKQWISMKERKE